MQSPVFAVIKRDICRRTLGLLFLSKCRSWMKADGEYAKILPKMEWKRLMRAIWNWMGWVDMMRIRLEVWLSSVREVIWWERKVTRFYVLPWHHRRRKECVTTILAWIWRNRIIYFSWLDAIKPFAASSERGPRSWSTGKNWCSYSSQNFLSVYGAILRFVLQLGEQNEKVFMLLA